MRQTARELGLSYDRFRKTWPELAQRLGLPRPFRQRAWDAEAIARWKAQRSARPLAAAKPSPPAPDAGRKARRQLEDLRSG